MDGNEREEVAAAVFTLLPASGLRKCLFRRTAKSPGLFLRLFPVIQDDRKDTVPSVDRKRSIDHLLHIHLSQIRHSYLIHFASFHSKEVDRGWPDPRWAAPFGGIICFSSATFLHNSEIAQ